VIVSDSTANETFSQKLVEEAALKGERSISYVRLIFCLLVLSRFVAIEMTRVHSSLELLQAFKRSSLELPALFSALAFSWYVLRISAKRFPQKSILTLSIIIDSLVCLITLLQNILIPTHSYHGIFSTPDVSALLLVTIASSFRLSVKLSFLSGILSILSSIILLICESMIHSSFKDVFYTFILFLIFQCSCMILSIAIAHRTKRLVAQSARLTAQSAQLTKHQTHTQQQLSSLLKEHHDAKGTLSAILLNVDLLFREVDSPTGSVKSSTSRKIVHELKHDSDELKQYFSRVQGDAVEQLQFEKTPVPIVPVLQAVVSKISQRFSTIRIQCSELPNIAIRISGGALNLESIFYNLLLNACEGNGIRGAQHVEIIVNFSKNTKECALQFLDDGPGFPPELLQSLVPIAGITTKAQGTGLGLYLVRGMVQVNHGKLELSNRSPQKGASVCIRFPNCQPLNQDQSPSLYIEGR
jgi:signal transduction histidine kinase